jgi:hypothetical protein
MTKWFHKCDLDWLKARQRCLTATDVKELLPFTKTGRKRTITDEIYLKVFARKLVNLTENDCLSTGAVARGHILEPYAIDRYNEEDFGGNEHLWHWDDIVISKDKGIYGSLSFSPDAMNVRYNSFAEKHWSSNYKWLAELTAIGEVKSYSAENHLARGYTSKDELDERWQLATAMAVCPSIQTAYLLFYNPSMRTQLYIFDYDRSDLQDEIEMILDVEEKWLAWLGNIEKLDHAYMVSGDPSEEKRIIYGIMKSEELNPENERSVIL